MRTKRPNLSVFVKAQLEKGVTSPAEMRDTYNESYKRYVKGKLKPYTSGAFTVTMRRLGITSKKRLEYKREAEKEAEVKDVTEYPQWENYETNALSGGVSPQQIGTTLKNCRQLISWCRAEGYMQPPKYTMKILLKVLKKYVEVTAEGWKSKGKVLTRLGAFNRVFTGIVPKSFSTTLKRPAGELKAFLEFKEFQDFLDHIEDTKDLSREGWIALFKVQLNLGCREGSKARAGESRKDDVTAKQGILGLTWEDINFKEKRCKLRDKGKRGMRGRLWTQLPLDLFKWLNGWEALLKFHEQTHGYKPSSEKSATGRIFPIGYQTYLREFHKIRHRCKTRISQDIQTMKPHILRKTHGQWCKRIGISLENICGDAEADVCVGRYGVGWTDPEVPLKYYLTKEAWEYEEQDAKIEKKMVERVTPQLKKLGLA